MNQYKCIYIKIVQQLESEMKSYDRSIYKSDSQIKVTMLIINLAFEIKLENAGVKFYYHETNIGMEYINMENINIS